MPPIEASSLARSIADMFGSSNFFNISSNSIEAITSRGTKSLSVILNALAASLSRQ